MDPVSHHHAAVYISHGCTFHMSEGKEKTHMHKNTMLKTTPNSLLTLQVSMWKQVLRNEQSPSDSEWNRNDANVWNEQRQQYLGLRLGLSWLLLGLSWLLLGLSPLPIFSSAAETNAEKHHDKTIRPIFQQQLSTATNVYERSNFYNNRCYTSHKHATVTSYFILMQYHECCILHKYSREYSSTSTQEL